MSVRVRWDYFEVLWTFIDKCTVGVDGGLDVGVWGSRVEGLGFKKGSRSRIAVGVQCFPVR